MGVKAGVPETEKERTDDGDIGEWGVKVGDQVRVAQRSIVGQVHEDQTESEDVHHETSDNNGISSVADGLLSQQAEGDSTDHLAHSDEDSGQADQLFGRLAKGQRKSDTGTVDATEKRQLQA